MGEHVAQPDGIAVAPAVAPMQAVYDVCRQDTGVDQPPGQVPAATMRSCRRPGAMAQAWAMAGSVP